MKKRQKSREELLVEVFLLIQKNPGIRPSELNRLINRAHSWNLRSTLIKRDVVRKEKDGVAVRYYPV